nr:hypothetical protein [Tanacetum cinerariifolium]
HKKLFKDVVGKLVKKQDVDLDALRALANAAVTVDSNIPSAGTTQIPAASLSVHTAGPTSALTVPPGTSTVPPGTSVISLGTSAVSPGTSDVPPGASTVLAGSPSVPADVPSSVASAGEAAKRLHDEELAQMDRQRAEVQRRRQQEVLDSAMYYNEADWLNIRARVEANASLSKTLLGDDVSKDNFPARMAALIKRKRQAMAEKAKERQNRPMTQAQQRAYMRQYVKNQNLDADAQSFIKVVVNEDFDDEVSPVWSALVGWEVIPTPLGDINALYRIDGS